MPPFLELKESEHSIPTYPSHAIYSRFSKLSYPAQGFTFQIEDESGWSQYRGSFVLLIIVSLPLIHFHFYCIYTPHKMGVRSMKQSSWRCFTYVGTLIFSTLQSVFYCFPINFKIQLCVLLFSFFFLLFLFWLVDLGVVWVFFWLLNTDTFIEPSIITSRAGFCAVMVISKPINLNVELQQFTLLQAEF